MKICIFTLFILTFFISPVYAGNYTWTGSSNTAWGTSGNWSPSGVPGSSDTININTTTNSLTLTAHRTVKRLVINSGVLNLGGDTLSISTSTGLNGGTINNGLFNANCTSLVNFNGTAFGAIVKAKGQIKLNGCVFDSTASFEHIGSASGTGSGGNTFNGVTTLKNSGTTTLRLAGTNADTFNNDVIINNVSPSGSGYLQLSYGAATYFNGNIEISSTSSYGIGFSSQGDGSSTLATGKAISIGSAGFVGTLVIQNFTQTGSTAQTLSISSVLNITNSTFNGAFTSTSTSILLSGCTFNNVSSFTKTGTSHDYSAGGNHFNNNSTFTNSASTASRIRLANSSGDTFGGDATFNTSNGLIEVAYSDTTEFHGDVSINNSKVTFNNSSGFVLCTGTASQEFGGSADFKVGKLIINKTTNGLTLQKVATIDSSLTLTKGIIFTDTINLITLKAGSTCSGASSLSYINGPMQKIGNSAFVFPIGKDGIIRKLGISAPSTNTDNYKAEFIDNFTDISTNGDTAAGTILGCDYWILNKISGSSSVQVSLYWDSLSCEALNYSFFRVSKLSGSTWLGDSSSSISGNELLGNVTSSVNYSSVGLFTISGLVCPNSGTVTINSSPPISFNYGPGLTVPTLNICAGMSISFALDQSTIDCLDPFGFGYFAHVPPTGTPTFSQVFPGTGTVTYTFNQAGTHEVKTKINNNVPLTNSQILNQANQTFTINVQQPTPDIFINNIAAPDPLIICDDNGATICADQTYASYLWSTSATTQCITVSTSGVYTLTVTDNLGCIGSTNITVNVGTTPPQAIIAGSTISCIDGGVDLPYSIVNPNNSYLYTWSSISAPTGWNIQSPQIISIASSITPTTGTGTLINYPNGDGNYIIQVITTEPNGCTSTTLYPVYWCCSETTGFDHIWENETSGNVTAPSSGNTCLIRGTFIVDVPSVWNNINIKMDPGAEIIIQPGITLSILLSNIYPCETFWKSITVDGGFVRIFDSQIEGAQIAVDVKNRGGYVIQGNSLFQDNYISLRVVDPTFLFARIFNDNTITRTNLYNVYYDFNGQNPPTCTASGDAPSHGILLESAGHILIGANNQLLPVIIDHVSIGIEANDTDLDVINTSFSDLIDRPCGAATAWRRSGVYASRGAMRTINLMTPGPNNCSFDNCRNGIFVNDAELIAIENAMDNVQFGIRYVNPPSHFTGLKSILNENDIKSSFRGIDVISTGTDHHTEIDRNHINALNGAGNGAGIYITDVPVIGKDCHINGNEINSYFNFRWGINILSHEDFRCYDNTIELDNSTAIATVGINARLCQNFNIDGNTIFETTSTQISNGIRIDLVGAGANQSTVQCNNISNCQRDFYFRNSSLNLDWAYNTMNGGRTGLRLDPGVNLLRNQPWNLWCGNFNNSHINILSGSNIGWFQFDFTNASGCITTPTGGMIIGGGSVAITDQPSSDPGCPEISSNSIEITDLDRFVATDSNWSAMEENILWQYRRSLANKLTLYPDLVTSDSIVNEFWSNQDLEEVILAGLMHNVVLIDSINKTELTATKVYIDSIRIKSALILENDSLLYTGLDEGDSVRISGENLKLDSIIIGWHQIADSLYEIATISIDSSRNSYYELYDNFESQSERGEVEKEVWKLILTYGYGSTTLINNEDSTSIADYANLCMSDYGQSIGYIRSLYEYLFGIFIDDEDICGNEESRIGSIAQQDIDVKLKFDLIPNPANSYVTIRLTHERNEPFNVKVLSAQGQVLLNVQKSSKESLLDIGELGPGIYIVKISDKKEESFRKLVILK